MAKLVFMPWGKSIETHGAALILDLARDLSLPLRGTCGGRQVCGQCKVQVKSAGPLPPPSGPEKERLGDLVEQGYRLACETALDTDSTVWIPKESQRSPQVILTSATDHSFTARLRPVVRQYCTEVPPPELRAVMPDRERFLSALSDAYPVKSPSMDSRLLQRLSTALRSQQGTVTATVRSGTEIVDLRPGPPGPLAGVAFDLGTTTVVAYLLDLISGEKLAVTSAVNPQISSGDDVISRIARCAKEEAALDRLRIQAVECLNQLLQGACSEAGIAPEQVVEATLVGNTAMNHLFLGLDPRHLAAAPYTPVFREAQDLKARDLGISMGSSGYIHLPPLKAGFVGNDTVAAVLATGLHRSRVQTLLIDLGTNGEIVAGSRERMVCCSTAAGPAFEGGHILWGMRGSQGAIERISVDPRSLEVNIQTIGNAPPQGLCGSGVISATAELIRAGIILHRGDFNGRIQTDRLREGAHGKEFVIVRAGEAAGEQDIVLTQKDVAELQMAKSAVHSGVALATNLLGADPIRRTLLAGAFGNYIDPRDACTIDLFPGGAPDRIKGVGNAAGYGACLTLLDRHKRREAARIGARMEYLELSGTPEFQDLFVANMIFSSARDYEEDS